LTAGRQRRTFQGSSRVLPPDLARTPASPGARWITFGADASRPDVEGGSGRVSVDPQPDENLRQLPVIDLIFRTRRADKRQKT
jgi:hypothetical protein